MTTFLSLALSGLYTLAIFVAGWWLGSYSRQGKLDAKIEEAVTRSKSKPPAPTQSGPIKPLTQEEWEAERQKPMHDKLADILGVKKT